MKPHFFTHYPDCDDSLHLGPDHNKLCAFLNKIKNPSGKATTKKIPKKTKQPTSSKTETNTATSRTKKNRNRASVSAATKTNTKTETKESCPTLKELEDSEDEDEAPARYRGEVKQNNPTASNKDATNAFFHSPDSTSLESRIAPVITGTDRAACKESALLGFAKPNKTKVYLNTHSPFCLCVCGVQGAGKSHTLQVVLESCLIPFAFENNTIELNQPMAALMFHYDQSESNVCEATGIVKLNPKLSSRKDLKIPQLPKVVVLVSPTFYRQRRKFYGLSDNADADGDENGGDFDVQPLLFSWSTLDAVQLRSLLHIEEKGNLIMNFFIYLFSVFIVHFIFF